MGGCYYERFIPQVIISDILKRLPAKSLLRFKLVCKPWRSIIEDPYFVHSHRIQSHVRPGGIKLLRYEYDHSPNFSLLNPEDECNSEPLQIPKELDCERYMKMEDYWLNMQQVEGLICFGDSHIWNPSTRKITKLPRLDSLNVSLDFRKAYNIKALSYHKYILGFDTFNKKYKVLSIGFMYEVLSIGFEYRRAYTPRNENVVTRICTLGDNSWRKIYSALPEELQEGFKIAESCYVNNVIFILLENNHNFLLAFELSREKFHKILFPVYSNTMFEVQDIFALFAYEDVTGATIWMLEDFENRKWKRIVITSVPVHMEGRRVDAVGSIHTDEVLFRSRSIRYYGYGDSFWFYYDLKNGTTRRVPKLSKELASKLSDDWGSWNYINVSDVWGSWNYNNVLDDWGNSINVFVSKHVETIVELK